jgi:hypothetical protein
VIENLLDAIDQSIEALTKKYYGVVTGTVKSVDDPLSLGRVQVSLPFLDALDLHAWARVATPMTGLLHGHYFIPAVDDEVLVAFEHGELRAPYVIGGLWHAFAPPPLPSPTAEVRALRTKGGNQLVLAERPATVTLQTGPTSPGAVPTPGSPTGPHSTLEMAAAGTKLTTPASLVLQVAESTITITPTSIELKCGGNTVTLTPGGTTIKAGGPLKITSAGPCTVKAPVIKLN